MCATYAPRDPVGEYWRGEITLRELRVLVEGLPPDSAAHRRVPSLGGWTHQDHLVATTVDLLNRLFHLTYAVNSKDGRYDEPDPLPRPGDAEREVLAARAKAAEHAAAIRRARAIEAAVLPTPEGAR